MRRTAEKEEKKKMKAGGTHHVNLTWSLGSDVGGSRESVSLADVSQGKERQWVHVNPGGKN